mmetsp:Transcript_108455/g.317298  ORF Transcript_108455/g.317298 Transcript_108455/m.317298 type:complete len:210 (-) Transcript_108455:424-1053(-)
MPIFARQSATSRLLPSGLHRTTFVARPAAKASSFAMLPPSFVSPSRSCRARLWSSCSLSLLPAKAAAAAAASWPGARRMAPPRVRRQICASSTASLLAQRAAPPGLPRPLEKQSATEAAPAQSSARGLCKATSAFQMRAPSRWMGQGRLGTASHATPRLQVVFSRQTKDAPSQRARWTLSGSGRPPLPTSSRAGARPRILFAKSSERMM